MFVNTNFIPVDKSILNLAKSIVNGQVAVSDAVTVSYYREKLVTAINKIYLQLTVLPREIQKDARYITELLYKGVQVLDRVKQANFNVMDTMDYTESNCLTDDPNLKNHVYIKTLQDCLNKGHKYENALDITVQYLGISKGELVGFMRTNNIKEPKNPEVSGCQSTMNNIKSTNKNEQLVSDMWRKMSNRVTMHGANMINERNPNGDIETQRNGFCR